MSSCIPRQEKGCGHGGRRGGGERVPHAWDAEGWGAAELEQRGLAGMAFSWAQGGR